MERLPQIVSDLEYLKQGQVDTRVLIKDEILDLKNEHISDIRKNICRIWMRLDDIRDLHNRATGAFYALRILWAAVGLCIGVAGTILSKHYTG